uniref:histone acetyltransferase n=2 Tax=Sus scrofa TaxID=9823 RepID=A0A8D1MLB8_PIG
MTEVVPSSALSEVSLRLLCHDDIDTVKHLCGDWFPIEYPDSWYRDITSNKKFFSLAATYRGAIVGMIVAEIKSRTKIHKEALPALLPALEIFTSPSPGPPTCVRRPRGPGVAELTVVCFLRRPRSKGAGRGFLPCASHGLFPSAARSFQLLPPKLE